MRSSAESAIAGWEDSRLTREDMAFFDDPDAQYQFQEFIMEGSQRRVESMYDLLDAETELQAQDVTFSSWK